MYENNSHNSYHQRFVLYAGFITFLVLAVLSLVYYQERMIFTDGAYYLFQLVKENKFVVFHHRFVALLTQMLPYAARHFEWSLNSIALLYSVSFPLISFLIFLWCYKVDVTGKWALVALLTPLLFTTATFFWAFSEMQQGILLSLLFFAFEWRNNYKQRWHWLLLPVILFSHLWSVIVFGYLVLFFLLRRQITLKQVQQLFAVCCSILLLKYLFLNDPYDHGSMGGLRNFLRLFPFYLSTYSFRNFIQNIPTQYYWLIILLAMNTAYYWRSKNWLQLCLQLVSFGGCLLMVTVCFPNAVTPHYYVENLLQPLAVLVLLPFVFDVLPQRSTIAANTVITAMIISGLLRIIIHAPVYEKRLDCLHKIYEQNKNHKTIIANKASMNTQLWDVWATPYEFWIIAQLQHAPTPAIIITDSVLTMQQQGNNPRVFLNTWCATPYNDYPTLYFQFKDTVTVYGLK